MSIIDDFGYDTPLGGDEVGFLMLSGILLMSSYYLVLRRFKWLKADKAVTERYEYEGFLPRFSFFDSWRQYEHFHVFLWLSKDLAWNKGLPWIYAILMIPTVLIALDFFITTISHPKTVIDGVHYLAQLLWVLANAVWAMGEVFLIGPDNPLSLWSKYVPYCVYDMCMMCILYAYMCFVYV